MPAKKSVPTTDETIKAPAAAEQEPKKKAAKAEKKAEPKKKAADQAAKAPKAEKTEKKADPQPDQLKPHLFRAGRIQPLEAREMMQGFRKADQEQGRDNEADKGLAEVIGGFEEAAHKAEIEQPEQHERPAQKH